MALTMEVRRYAPELEATWDAFIASSRNGTFFHTRSFLSYHPKDRFEDASLLFFEGNRLLAVLPAAIQHVEVKKSLVAHPGATYGGLVLSEKAGASDTCAVVEALVARLRSEEFSHASLLRLTSSGLQRMPSEDLEYALLTQGFRLLRSELGSAIVLAGLTEEHLLTSLDIKCRNKVRQAERAGVTVRVTDDYASFWPILEATLGGRHAVRPTHTLEEMQKLASLFPEIIRLFGAYRDGMFLAGIVTVDIADHAVYTKYMAQDFSHQQDRPLNLLLTEVIRDGLRRGKRVLDLGVSMEEGAPRGINEGIFAFKEGFGGRSVRRESFILDL